MKKFKILIIGKNSFIGSNIHYFLKTKYSSKIQSFTENITNKLHMYDYIINCSINQKYIKCKYDEKNKYITENKINKLHKNNSVILRISNLIGYRKKNPRKKHLTYVDYLIKMLNEGRLYKNSKRFKDFLDIGSFSKIIYLVIKNEVFGTYNASIGKRIYLNEINQWILHYYKPKKN